MQLPFARSLVPFFGQRDPEQSRHGPDSFRYFHRKGVPPTSWLVATSSPENVRLSPNIKLSRINTLGKIVTAGVVVVAVAAAAGGGYAFVQQQAEKQLAATIAAIRTSLPPGSELTYASAKADALSRGARLDNVTVKTPDGVLITEELIVSGIGPTSADSVVLTNAKLAEATGETVTAAHVEGKNISGVQFIQGPNGKLILDPSTIAFNSLEIRTLRSQRPQSDADPLAIAIGTVRLTGYGAGKLRHGEVSNVQFDAARATFNQLKLQSASVDNANIASIIATAQEQLPTLDAVTGLSVDGFEMSQAGVPRIHLASLDITSHSDTADIDSATADLKGLEATVPPLLNNDLSHLGYTRFAADLRLKSTYAHATQTLTLAPLQIDLPDIGNLTLNATLHNVPTNVGRQNAMAFLAMDVGSLDVSYTDRSLVKRMEIQGARQEGLSQQDFVTELQHKLVTSGIGRGSQPATQAFARALTDFIATPRTLHIISKPASPLPVMQLGLLAVTNPDELVRAFGLTAEMK
jgi:hypothetical protein